MDDQLRGVDVRRARRMARHAPSEPQASDPVLWRAPAQCERQMLKLPNRLERQKSREPNGRECPAHRAWVRKHHCCVPGCMARPIECAHVRRDTDGGIAPQAFRSLGDQSLSGSPPRAAPDRRNSVREALRHRYAGARRRVCEKVTASAASWKWRCELMSAFDPLRT